MSWYYVQGEDRKGPVEPQEFHQLVEQGEITGATLVWQDGMSNWQTYAELGPRPSPPEITSAAIEPSFPVCSECGRAFAADEVIRIGGQWVCAGCKPIATQKLREGVVSPKAEQVRKDHINHEASIKSVGVLYFLAATALFLVSVVSMGSAVAGGRRGAWAEVVTGLLFLVLGGAQLWIGIGLRQLKPWARIPSGVLSGIGLLGFPLGTVINGYILYLLFSRKGATVFSEDYRRVIEQTPQVKYRTSIIVWVAVGLLVLLLGAIAVGVFFAPHRVR